MKQFIKNRKRPMESGVVYIVGTGDHPEDLDNIPEGADIFGANYGADERCKYVGSVHHKLVRNIKHSATSFSVYPYKGVDFVVRTKPINISSGIYCAYVAALMGYDDIRLVNIPLSGRYYESFNKETRNLPDSVKSRITSYSGWTREYFGDARNSCNE